MQATAMDDMASTKKRLGHKQQIVPLANLTWRLNGQHQLMSHPHLSIFSRPMQFWERARAEGKAVGQFHPIQAKIPFPIARRSKSKDKHRFSTWTLMTVAAWRSFNFTSDWFHSSFPNCLIGTGGWSMTQKSTANEGASDVILIWFWDFEFPVWFPDCFGQRQSQKPLVLRIQPL